AGRDVPLPLRRPSEHEGHGDGRLTGRPFGRGRASLVMVTVAVVGVALVAGAAGCASGPRRIRSAAVGQPPPPFRLPNVRESEPDVSLVDVAGRPLVINFWASWCVPCRKEMPAFEAVHRRRGDRVSFIGIDRQDDRSDALRFLARTGVSYPLGYDPDARLDAAYRRPA